MRVNFYATLRQIVGQKTVEFKLPLGATAQDVLDVVVERFPALRPELVDEHGQLLEHIHLFINGRDVPHLEIGWPQSCSPRTSLTSSRPLEVAELMAKEVQVHGIPRWLLREYLEDLGGVVQTDESIVGDGWRARIKQLPPAQIGSLRVGRVELRLEGSREALDALRPQLQHKTMRAGA